MNNIVRLDKRISFIALDIVYDDMGFPIEGSQILYTCWSNVKRLSFKEFKSSATTNTKIIDSFRVRKCNIINNIDSKKYKIKYNNRIYNIIYINPDNQDYVDFKGEVVE